ncbi:MAG: aldo/keto reductase [Desulfofustis sp.]|nr:aldo/keto reductase [Desulfofustis sp.]
MIYRRFGKTGLDMPVLSFGCMRSMHSWQTAQEAEIPQSSQDNLRLIVETALLHGINHFETAHGYGSSEQQLGRILPHIPRNDFILQSKAVPSDDPQEFVAKVKLSMTRLGVDRLELLALHGLNDHRSLWQCCRKNGCLAAARKLQDEGLVDHVGFSGHGPTDVILQALAHQQDGGFDFCNIHWYYIFDANREAIDFADAHDIGIFIISPSDKGGHLHSPTTRLQELCKPLSPMLFNDLYCLDKKGVCTVSVGASEPHHFDEHLKVLPFLESGDRTAFQAADARLRAAMDEISGHERPDHHWHSFPGWDSAPGNVNIKMTLWLANLYRAWDMKNFARERYAMLNRGSSWVQGNDGAKAADLDFSETMKPSELSADRLKQLLIEAHALLKKNDERS